MRRQEYMISAQIGSDLLLTMAANWGHLLGFLALPLKSSRDRAFVGFFFLWGGIIPTNPGSRVNPCGLIC